MSGKTKIQWATDQWNPITGCTKVSQGCKHCYAEREWPRLAAPLGIACGGVDTVDNINPETGKPFGPGGHTGWALTDRVKKMLAVVEAAQVGHYAIAKGNCGCGLCTSLRTLLRERRKL